MAAWPGAVFLFFATLFMLVKGYDTRIKEEMKPDDTWTPVTMDRIREIQKLTTRTKTWDRDLLDITNPRGIFMFVLVVAVLYICSTIISKLFISHAIVTIIVTDVIILVLPLWFNGIRRVSKEDDLSKKINIVIKMEEYFNTIKKEGEYFKPAILLAHGASGKSVPIDVRFNVSFEGMPEDFYGIQGQIHFNEVNGSVYPYFYCVIPAKAGSGLRKFAKDDLSDEDIIREYQVDDHATEVLVIRQRTTETSGYHTNIETCKDILTLALETAKVVLE
jgi:hypothetical protein